jgi:hypothetical protein
MFHTAVKVKKLDDHLPPRWQPLLCHPAFFTFPWE